MDNIFSMSLKLTTNRKTWHRFDRPMLYGHKFNKHKGL